MSTSELFLNESRHNLRDVYLPKIGRCVDALSREDLWWRPNAESNSVGNLILHLAGNLRQWVVSGVGGQPDTRDRPAEFAAGRTGEEELPDASRLMRVLEDAVSEADRVLAETGEDRLGASLRIQGRDVTGLGAVYHAVEHFSMHTGQILYITKLRTATDLGFYQVEGGIARPNW